MHIKSVILSGFKSYNGETVVQDFDRGFNVIVGRNGSGKSNLFQAIQLALTDDFNRLSSAARSALLHNGKATHDTCFVQIIFDNEDGLLPFEEKEVSFKRYIGGKKDRYEINGKQTKEFRSYLQTAGFINPYYFIKQGSVTDVATTSDRGRFNYFTIVSGSKSWDEAKERILRIIHSTTTKLRRMTSMMTTLADTRTNLQEQNQRLVQLTELKNRKRAYEYVVNIRLLTFLLEAMNRTEEKRNQLSDDLHPIRIRQVLLSKEINTRLIRVEVAEWRRNNLLREKAEVTARVEAATQVKSKDACSHADLLQEVQAARANNVKLENELEALEKEKKKLEGELNKILPEYEKYRGREAEAEAEYQNVKSVFEEHKVKFGVMTSAWKTKELKPLVKDLRRDLVKRKDALAATKAKLEKLDEEIPELEVLIEGNKAELLAGMNQRTEMDKSLVGLRRDLLNLGMERRMYLEREMEIEERKHAESEALTNLEQQLQRMACRPKALAWLNVQKVLKGMSEAGGFENVLSGYHGLLLENISCEEELWPAVEVCAGDKLFFHVVKNNGVGLAIVKEFNRMKFHGDVVFLPLENLFVPAPMAFASLDERVLVLKERLECEKGVEKVVEMVFGNKLLCRDLEVAVQASRTYKTTCVTMDGDKVLSQGPVSGGYRDTSVSALRLQRARQASKLKIAKYEVELERERKNLRKVDSVIETRYKEKENYDSKLARIVDGVEVLQISLNSSLENLRLRQDEKIQDKILSEKQTKACMELEAEEKQFQLLLKFSSDQTQTHSPLNSAKVKVLLSDHKGNVEVCAKRRTTGRRLARLESNKQKIESNLRNIAQKRVELEIGLQSESERLLQMKVEEMAHKVATFERNIQSDEDKVSGLDVEIAQADQELQKMKETVTKYERKETRIQDALNIESSKLDSLIMEQNVLRKKVKDCEVKNQSIGSFPKLVPTLEKMPTKAIEKKLQEVNVSLKGIPEVNLAVAQILQEAEENYEKFQAEENNATRGHRRMNMLMDIVEGAKTRLIFQACRVLQKNFSRIFKDVVPTGQGNMVLTTESGLEFTELTTFDEPDTTEVSELWRNQVFNGLSLRVRFAGNIATECAELRLLSGGQKSIVALAFILALQKCDPVSLYLFDEVDQALDPTYRKAVGKKLKELSQSAQFICSTFRREFLDYADKFYGVYYRNQASNIKVITKEEANDFMEDTPERTPSPSASPFASLLSNRFGSGSGSDESRAQALSAIRREVFGKGGNGGKMCPPPPPKRRKLTKRARSSAMAIDTDSD